MKHKLGLIFTSLLIFSFGLTGCGSSSSSSTPAPTPDPRPTASIPGGIPLGNDQPVVIRFSESMNTGTVALGGALSMVAHTPSWSMTNTMDDTLTLTPNAGWGTGSVVLTIDGDDLDATPNSMTQLVHNFNVYAGTLYYVDSGAVDDSGDGLTMATAKQTINAAIAQTVTDMTNPAAVVVNSGTYNVNSAVGTGTHVAVVEGVSLYGSYSSDFSERDTTTHASIIQDTSIGVLGSFTATPNRALEASTGITAATTIDSFTINGSDAGDYSAGAAIINSADPTLVNNIFNGGGATNNFGLWTRDTGTNPLVDSNTLNGGAGISSYGMFVLSASSPTIQANTFNGGNGATDSYGLYVLHMNSDPTIDNNTFNGGSGVNSSNGLGVVGGASPTVQNNNIYGGSSVVSSRGVIVATNATPTIQTNTIDGGTGTNSSIGIRVYNSGDPIIQQNTSITGGISIAATGIELSGAGTTALIENNTAIYGGAATGTSRAIDAYTGTEVTIRQNSLIQAGGSGSAISSGISLAGALTSSVVERNKIYGGAGAVTYGVLISATAIPVHNNLIHSGNGTSNSYGAYISAMSNSILRNNTIYAGNTGGSAAISLIGGSAPVIENNILFSSNATGVCISEESADSDAASIANNNLNGCGGTIFYDADGSCGDLDGDMFPFTCNLADMELLSGTYQNNTADDATTVLTDVDGADDNIDTMADNDWTLNTATGNIANAGLNGIDETGWGFTDDFAGTTRPGAAAGAWAKGAYEHP